MKRESKPLLRAISLCIGLSLSLSLGLAEARDYLEGPVTAKDFQAKPPALTQRLDAVQQTQEQAEIATGISIATHIASQYRLDSQSAVVSSEVEKIELRTLMTPEKSWLDPESYDDAELLQHEQGHFDLTEIQRRQLQLRLDGLRAEGKLAMKEVFGPDRSETQLQADMERQRELLQQRLNEAVEVARQLEAEAQKRYDRDTFHGINKEQQAHWWYWIQQRLQQP